MAPAFPCLLAVLWARFEPGQKQDIYIYIGPFPTVCTLQLHQTRGAHSRKSGRKLIFHPSNYFTDQKLVETVWMYATHGSWTVSFPFNLT